MLSLTSRDRASALLMAGMLFVLPSCVLAHSDKTEFWSEAVNCLHEIDGLSQLAQAIAIFNSSSVTDAACPMLGKAVNESASMTFFAPTDSAFAQANLTANITALRNSSSDVTNSSASNPSLASILCYHLVSGNFSNPTAPFWNQSIISAKSPNVTIARTMLSDPNFVQLEGNKAQVLAWSSMQNKTTILNQAMNVTVSNVTKCPSLPNLIVGSIDGVLLPPPVLTSLPDFTYINQTNGLTSLKYLLNGTDISGTNINGTWLNTTSTSAFAIPTAYDADHDYHHFSNTGEITKVYETLNTSRGFTLFAPTNAAFQLDDATRVFQALAGKPEEFHTLLENHVINATAVYSTDIESSSKGAKWVSAAGRPLTFFANETGKYVNVGTDAIGKPLEARLIKTDVLVANGVLHLIDRVLVQLEHDEDRAEKAHMKVTSVVATQTGVETGVVGSADSGIGMKVGNEVDAAEDVLVGLKGWVAMLMAVAFGVALV